MWGGKRKRRREEEEEKRRERERERLRWRHANRQRISLRDADRSTSETLKENKRLARWSVNVDRKEQWDGKSAMAEGNPRRRREPTAADEKSATAETKNVNVMGTVAPAARSRQ